MSACFLAFQECHNFSTHRGDSPASRASLEWVSAVCRLLETLWDHLEAPWASFERVLRIEHIWFFGSVSGCFDLFLIAPCLKTNQRSNVMLWSWCVGNSGEDAFDRRRICQWRAALGSHDTSYKADYGWHLEERCCGPPNHFVQRKTLLK